MCFYFYLQHVVSKMRCLREEKTPNRVRVGRGVAHDRHTSDHWLLSQHVCQSSQFTETSFQRIYPPTLNHTVYVSIWKNYRGSQNPPVPSHTWTHNMFPPPLLYRKHCCLQAVCDTFHTLCTDTAAESATTW